MIIRPMVGAVEVPSIERIATVEGRRVAVLPVPGLLGDLRQDLGAASLAVEITGSLQGDARRDEFLGALRPAFQAGEPLPFVADILTATKVDRVLIEALDVEEVNEAAGGFRYRIVLQQYVEPPEPPPALDSFGLDIDASLADLAADGLAGLGLPDLLGAIPDVANPAPALLSALDGVKEAAGGVSSLLGPLESALGV
jgi:hypothetical protein